MNNKTSTCCTCGYSWHTGENGSHQCSVELQSTIKRLEHRVASLEKCAQFTNSPVCSISTTEIAKNIRRNLKHIHRKAVNAPFKDPEIIDLINHIDSLAQQIENGN